ncbi:Phosphotyrosyl phosphatase activator, partial [Tilletiopsis washingtonensis]
MAHWRASAAHALLERFLARLAEAAVGHATQLDAGAGGSGATSNAGSSAETFDGIAWVLGLLAELARWTDEIAPLQSPQRFGNLAFRTWGARCEERLEALHAPLPAALQPYIPELASYLRGAFGSWVRLDYGSGHELALLAWLCTLARLGAFGRGALAEPPIDESATAEPQAWERALATQVVPAYLALVWGLQDRYGLEPAGSHGVWGLDDYHFIPYVIGAAQLRNQNSYLPSFIAAVSASSDRSPRALLQERASAPFANLLTSSVLRIHALKRGPFHEHSPILSDVSRTVPNFAKVAAGMLKMWRAECTGKRPVVQHFVFGGV